MDILDGNVARDTYGVLVIQSPTSPSEDRVFVNSVSNENTILSPTQPRDLDLKGKSYRRHMPILEIIKRKLTFMTNLISYIYYMPYYCICRWLLEQIPGGVCSMAVHGCHSDGLLCYAVSVSRHRVRGSQLCAGFLDACHTYFYLQPL